MPSPIDAERLWGELMETAAIGGTEISQLYEGERRYAILLRYPESYRNSLDVVRDTLLRTSDNALIPLESVASIRLVDSPPVIAAPNGNATKVASK